MCKNIRGFFFNSLSVKASLKEISAKKYFFSILCTTAQQFYFFYINSTF
jgi:hypothetical protein